MKTAVIGMVGMLILAGGLSAQKASSFSVRNDETFTGEITDSYCAQGHHIDMIKSARNCILTCVNSDGAKLVLYDSNAKRIYKLDDQRQPEPFAGQDVTVTGQYDKGANAIHVTSIRPRIIYAGL